MDGRSFCMDCVKYYVEHRTLNMELVASRAETTSPSNQEDEGGGVQKVMNHAAAKILSRPHSLVACGVIHAIHVIIIGTV